MKKSSWVSSVALCLALLGCAPPPAALPDAAVVEPDTGVDATTPEVDAAVEEDAAVPAVDAFAPPDAFDYDGGPPATWDEVYALFDSVRCGGGTSGCHYDSTPSASLSLATSATACAQLHRPGRSLSCGIDERVVAGDLSASLLFQKLLGPVVGCGDRMPDGRTPLTPEEISVVGRWILAGATCP